VSQGGYAQEVARLLPEEIQKGEKMWDRFLHSNECFPGVLLNEMSDGVIVSWRCVRDEKKKKKSRANSFPSFVLISGWRHDDTLQVEHHVGRLSWARSRSEEKAIEERPSASLAERSALHDPRVTQG